MTHRRASCFLIALLASSLTFTAPVLAGFPPGTEPPGEPAAAADVEPGDITVLGAAIVERPAPPESLGAGHAAGKAWRRLALSPHPLDRCEYFLIFEVSTGRFALDTRDALDAYMLSHALVVMRNLDPRWAVGAGAQFHWATGNIKLAPEVRVRRWFGREQSVEAAFGWLLATEPAAYGGDFLQQVGPIASLRYSPHPWVFVQAGATQYREFRPVYVPPYSFGAGEAREDTKVFAGIGFAGTGALVALGGEVIAFVGLIAAFAGMD